MKERFKAVPRKWGRWRHGLRHRRFADLGYRVAVGVVGLLVLAVGIVAIPYPGPGWAIVFVGLGILATEFEWARRLLAYVRKHYDAVMAWFGRQGRWVQALGVAVTAAVVVATLWVFGALGWVAALIGVDWPWLKSPLAASGS
ncbi:TIGR02611 family protein [Mycolicibacterium komossense]|uniref:TIGR02611 family protein n=1 Tax=Mycolicibacterium komossense TaxID=1779 RepID=A0ABT3CH30_9MYCO|nr:TIGR02611 family protein [Mycolicibacterium komossense]MCV7228773.1 TIGR02611 family protein [Mycolicibacterium komossense]